MQPSIGRIVHYVSYGTPGGEYTSQCRAAVVTAIREDSEYIDVAVLNPTGMFFDRSLEHSEDDHKGGTWHWPERVNE